MNYSAHSGFIDKGSNNASVPLIIDKSIFFRFSIASVYTKSLKNVMLIT